MLFEKLCDGHGVFALPLDALAECLDAANEEIRGAGIHRAAEVNNHLADALHPFRISDGNAGNDVGVASQGFGGTVDDHVVAEGDGVLQDGRGKCVVNDGNEFVFFGEGYGEAWDWWEFRRREPSNAA